MTKMRTALLLAALGAIALSAARATNGMRMIGFGAVQDAMGGVGVGATLDAASLLTNPAGMADLGHRLDLGGAYFKPSVSYSATGIVPGMIVAQDGATLDSDRGASPIPVVAYVQPLTDRLTIGVGVFGVAGMGVDYAANLFNGATLTSYMQGRFTPAAAYRVNDRLSLGVTGNLMVAQMKYDVASGAGQAAHDTATSVGVGATFGVKFTPVKRVTLGAAYETAAGSRTSPSRSRSAPNPFMPGTTIPGGTDTLAFDQPQSATVGVSVTPVDALLVGVDLQWIDWSSTMGRRAPQVFERRERHRRDAVRYGLERPVGREGRGAGDADGAALAARRLQLRQDAARSGPGVREPGVPGGLRAPRHRGRRVRVQRSPRRERRLGVRAEREARGRERRAAAADGRHRPGHRRVLDGDVAARSTWGSVTASSRAAARADLAKEQKSMTLTRRKFIQIGGAARRRRGRLRAHHALVGARRGPRRGSPDRGRPRRRHVLRALLLGLRGEGAREGRAGHEDDRQPRPPALARHALPARRGGDRAPLRSRSPEEAARPHAKRGEDVFEEVTWDAALNASARGSSRRRARHGPEAVALFTHGSGGVWFKHFMKAWGSPNVGAPSYAQCRGPREAGYLLTFGTPLGSPEPIDLANARVITLIGSHLGENMHNTQVQELAEAIGRGAGSWWWTRASRSRPARRATGCRSSRAPTSRSSSPG